MIRPWPDTLAGRTLSLLIGMTLLLLVGAALLLYEERRERFDERTLRAQHERVATLVRLLDDADAAERVRIIARLSRAGEEITLHDRPRIDDSGHPLERRIAHDLHALLGGDAVAPARVRVRIEQHDHQQAAGHHGSKEEHGAGHDGSAAPAVRVRGDSGHGLHLDALRAIAVSVRLRDGTWVDYRTTRIDAPPPWARRTLQLLGLLLLLVTASGLVIARRMAQPMARLADAATRFGLGQPQPPLPERGPREVRETIRAFNDMRERLSRHLQDRSRMLAAVSHDLRTPITTLRLRAEYIADDEMRERTLATLDEMQRVLAAALAFARDEAADERPRAIDLAALLQTLVDDHADLGREIRYIGPDRSTLVCRPVSLRRALNNLIDNALTYGGAAEVRLSEDGSTRLIQIDDDGPGIPEDMQERVFAPFMRLEPSRNRETGGIGLGLSLARTIVHAHGGRIELANRPGGGLRVGVLLPGSDHSTRR